MPLIEYRCADHHITTKVRKYAERDALVVCHCGRTAQRIEISAAHVPLDGLYSYAPNVGSADRFERQRAAIKEGVKVIDRVAPTPASHRDGQYSARERE